MTATVARAVERTPPSGVGSPLRKDRSVENSTLPASASRLPTPVMLPTIRGVARLRQIDERGRTAAAVRAGPACDDRGGARRRRCRRRACGSVMIVSTVGRRAGVRRERRHVDDGEDAAG